MRVKISVVAAFTLLALGFGCRKEKVPEPYKPTDAHDAYRHALVAAGLGDTALGRDWLEASKKALVAPVKTDLPFAEVFYADPSEAFAVAYGFEVKRGQRVEIEVASSGEKTGRIFIDLFRVEGGSPEQWIHAASADESENRLEFEPRRDAEYIVRLQPELLRGGQIGVTIRKVASLGFPVAGKDSRAIQSGFGASRDGGRRVHHGVDIFARRHTPVLAPSDALVQRVGDGGIGGNTIWLYDSKRRLYLYFAHLQTQDVEPYTNVKAGQQIGTVGNTGNARTTPPHLHFGVYMRSVGAVDPYHFINEIEVETRAVSADLQILGRWGRAKDGDVPLKTSWVSRSETVVSIDSHSAMKILAAAGGAYRVLLPDGISGYVSARDVEPAADFPESRWTSHSLTVMEGPSLNAAAMDVLVPGEEYHVLGKYEDSFLVQTLGGRIGWVSASAVPADLR